MWDLFSNWLPWWMPTWLPLGGGASLVLLAGALALLGVTPVIGALAKIAAVVVDFARMLLENIIIPGVKHILSNTASIVTICLCGWLLYGAVDAMNSRTEYELRKSRDYFATELRGFKATLAKTRQELAQCKAAVGKRVQNQAPAWPF